MSDHLAKAKAALEHAGEVVREDDGKRTAANERLFLELLDIARVQATVAQAEATERLVSVLDRRLGAKR